MSANPTFNPSNKLAELIAARKALLNPTSLNIGTGIGAVETKQPEQITEVPSHAPTPTDRYGHSITYNADQQAFIDLASSGSSCVLIGSAGTGKTTCMKGVVSSICLSNSVPILRGHDHKYLPTEVPGIVIISYTRRAVNNIRKNLSSDMQDNCLTFHKLLEYQPEYFEVTDNETGETKTTMRFTPARNPYNPLPEEISTVIIEESSMLSKEYYDILMEALPHNPQIIFLGDIYQLPPVFGSAILGYKLTTLPVIELTQVYRQALNSPIISLAQDIKNGKTLALTEKVKTETTDGIITLHPWKKKLHPEDACNVSAKFLIQALEAGIYNPEEDIILIPFNKGFGTIELNRFLATALAKRSNSVVHEIIAGFNKHYLRIGEKIMYDREDAEVIAISRNGTYLGKRPQEPSEHMDYWGACSDQFHHSDESALNLTGDVDFILEQMSAQAGKEEEKVNQASHLITLRLLDTDREVTISTARELNNCLLGYALTVHKAQGSEWSKVFILFHGSHATMLNRELLYTAITRAKNEVYCICEKETFVAGVKSQKIKGTTLAEKAQYFIGKDA